MRFPIPARPAALGRASLVAALALLVAAAAPPAAGGARAPRTHTVAMEGTRFVPELLAVSIGDSVVWVNKDPFPHTATSEAGRFDSKPIDEGKSWKFKAGRKGEFSYVCTLHPTMKGTLTVK